MEKISKIIAPSARTKNYDVARALPGRPGSPNLGRPEKMELPEDRLTITDQLVEPILNGDTFAGKGSSSDTYKPRDSGVKSQIVKELTNKFFAKENPKEIARQSDQTHSEETVTRLHSSTGSSVNPESSSDASL
jgi:hypothetical protein